MILIDEPQWHAHGTTWAHLISDVGLAELHAFARHFGLPRRAFDLDHYDVPAARHTELIAAGAVPVSRRELIFRLSRSGLRVPGHARGAAKRQVLAARWIALLPDEPHLGHELLDRWHEPHRVYHDPTHLTHVLDSHALLLELSGTVPAEHELVAERLALWFHDAIYTAGVTPPGADEEESAQLAVTCLGPLAGRHRTVSTEQVDQVARLVLLTHQHSPATGDDAGARVSDADLAVLGSAPDRYARYTAQIRQEFQRIPDDVFYPGRAEILGAFLSRGEIFHTPTAQRRWEIQAQRNLRAELATDDMKKPRSAF